MGNASKALIIAGAILISILLISVGILIFNNAKGTTTSADDVDFAMKLAAQKTLAEMDITNHTAFNSYIIDKYDIDKGSEGRGLSKEEVIELCELITERCKKLTGNLYDDNVTSLSKNSFSLVYYRKKYDKIVYDGLNKSEATEFEVELTYGSNKEGAVHLYIRGRGESDGWS